MKRSRNCERRTVLARLLRSLTAFGLILLALSSQSGAIIKDPGFPADPILDRLAPKLDGKGIDVRRQWSGLVKPDPARPQLARLFGYPAEAKPFLSPTWVSDFKVGTQGYEALIAIDESSSNRSLGSAGRPTPQQFVERWRSVDPSKRVFVSFTRANSVYAQTIRATLEAEGYVVFTYRGVGSTAPEFSPKTVGELFKTSGHHFVIDTPEARRSIGVSLEAHSLRVIDARAKAATAAKQAKVGAEAHKANAPKPPRKAKPTTPNRWTPSGGQDFAEQMRKLREELGLPTANDPSRQPAGCPAGQVRCMCGGRDLGCVSSAACIPGTPCG